MDHDTRELISRLCAKAGMIMEDASLIGMTMVATDQASLPATLARLQAALVTAGAAIDAAVLVAGYAAAHGEVN